MEKNIPEKKGRRLTTIEMYQALYYQEKCKVVVDKAMAEGGSEAKANPHKLRSQICAKLFDEETPEVKKAVHTAQKMDTHTWEAAKAFPKVFLEMEEGPERDHLLQLISFDRYA